MFSLVCLHTHNNKESTHHGTPSTCSWLNREEEQCGKFTQLLKAKTRSKDHSMVTIHTPVLQSLLLLLFSFG